MRKIYCILLILFVQSNLWAQQPTSVQENYSKIERYITMRDGVKLFTAIYIPKDITSKNKYPFLMQRTCYSVAPYGENNFVTALGYNPYMQAEKYIYVNQDVRGRYMSEGTFTNMTPQVVHKTKKDVDESTDTYDTIDWLLKNIPNNNGKVGQYGISYPGFYTAVGLLANHPALKASAPQAPISDFWFDDFHHNGSFLMGYFRTFPVFGIQKTKAEKESWFNDQMNTLKATSLDGSIFYNEMGTLKEAADKYYKDNFFMQEIINHPNYDSFWQKRGLLQHLKGVKHAVLTVGGWFDAEDLSGPLNIFKTINKNNPENTKSTIVIGPFSHGAWAHETGKTYHNDIYFGDSIASFYQKNVEAAFFHHYLKDDKNKLNLPRAYVFDTGNKNWNKYDAWPPKESQKMNFYLEANGALSTEKQASNTYTEYFSDPNHPVPSSENRKDLNGFTPRNYMSEDQRFAENRPDVATFTTPTLTDDITFAGEIWAKLKIMSSSSDADFFVKIIDVYPPDEKGNPDKPNVIFANYHQMVRSEIMPARFRNSFEKPEALVPNKEAAINFRLQDVMHTFKKGHKIQIQVQSTAYPLFALNPQQFLENPYLAKKSDYTKAFEKISNTSVIEVEILK